MKGSEGQLVQLCVFPRLMITQIRPCFLLIRSAVSQDLFKAADVHIQTCEALLEGFCVLHFPHRHTRLCPTSSDLISPYNCPVTSGIINWSGGSSIC